MVSTQLRPMSFGEILDGTFTLYRRHFFAMFGASLIPFIPGWLLYGTVSARLAMLGSAPPTLDILPILLMAAVVGVCGFAVATGAVTRQVSQAYLGEPVSIGDGLGRGFGSLFSMLVVVILTYLALLAPTVGIGVAAAIVIPTLATSGGGVVTVIVLGLVAVALAMVLTPIIASGLFAVVPAIVVEGTGPFGALGRSWSLSKGAWLRILGVLGVSWLIAMLPAFGVGVLGGVGALMLGSAAGTVSVTQVYIQQGLSSLVWALTFPFLVGCTVLQYYDRRIRQEGYDLEVAAESLATAD